MAMKGVDIGTEMARVELWLCHAEWALPPAHDPSFNLCFTVHANPPPHVPPSPPTPEDPLPLFLLFLLLL